MIFLSVVEGAVNIDDGNGDYGKIVLVTFDVHIADVSAEFLQFSLIDDGGRTFVAIAATVEWKDCYFNI